MICVHECASCGQPLADGAVVCVREADRTAGRLREAAELWTELQRAVVRQTRMGDPGPRSRQRAPAEPIRPDVGELRHYADQEVGHPAGLPVDLRASDVADGVRDVALTWARVIAEETGADLPTSTAELLRWLAGRVQWVRHQQWAAEALDELEDAGARVARAVDRREPTAWLGPCLEPDGLTGQCPGELHARVGAARVRCGTCGSVHDTSARRGWLDGLVAVHCFTAAEIEAAVGVRADRIRKWASRGRIAQHGQDRYGRPLYRLGEVVELLSHPVSRGVSRAK